MLKFRKRIRNKVLSGALLTNLIFRCHPFFSWYYGHSSSYFTDGHLLLRAYTTWSILESKHKILWYGQSTLSQCEVTVCGGHFWAIPLPTGNYFWGGHAPRIAAMVYLPPAALFPLGKEKNPKKKNHSEEKVVREHKGSMMKPLDSDALEPDDTSGTFYQNLLQI